MSVRMISSPQLGAGIAVTYLASTTQDMMIISAINSSLQISMVRLYMKSYTGSIFLSLLKIAGI